ncbi:hypothetical protein HPP92_007049 [Vanilla planifolia]|uniref:Protein EARLY HEADING DATE 2 n=1 Tax=Vanilla planifolia TaxID=51239 RepID=A0A835RJP5_VANPL|nr:hypothetical protein HPP92_007049 [Vanilla planifolia]
MAAPLSVGPTNSGPTQGHVGIVGFWESMYRPETTDRFVPKQRKEDTEWREREIGVRACPHLERKEIRNKRWVGLTGLWTRFLDAYRHSLPAQGLSLSLSLSPSSSLSISSRIVEAKEIVQTFGLWKVEWRRRSTEERKREKPKKEEERGNLIWRRLLLLPHHSMVSRMKKATSKSSRRHLRRRLRHHSPIVNLLHLKRKGEIFPEIQASADAEVIALSPKTLMATNRFVCEVCNKGFQREQNLQLHRRGHNLPWKLKQKSGGGVEPRRRVYLCPEPTCVHHHPSRALGDLTGIKKHFCRKHGEKKWRCDRCSKRYAVQSDWKAHSKTCGTREYRCDCGTLFSRRDSFITHRAFCDALAQESARLPIGLRTTAGSQVWFGSGGVGFGFTQLASSDHLSSLHDQTHPTTHFDGQLVPTPPPTTFLISGNDTQPHPPPFHDLVHLPSSDPLFFHNAQHVLPQVMEGGEQPLLGQSTLPQMSATMLLQRAAQIGATSSGIGGGSMQEMMMSSFADGRFGNVGGGMVCDLEEPAFREIGFTRDFLGMGPAAEMSLGAEEMKSAADSFCYGGRQG